jgi:hypothetical protein
VQGISEVYLLPVLAFILSQFPFVIKGFQSGNDSEYVNRKVAEPLTKWTIEQAKSRARQSNETPWTRAKTTA